MVDHLRARRDQHNYISQSSPEKFGMTFPNNAWEHAKSAPEICRNGNELTFRQNIGHSRFTDTSNHHKIHIYIKPPQASHMHQTQASHIQQTQANKSKYMGHKWNKRVWERVHLLQYETK